MTFTGFPKQTFLFLAGLANNNSKAWFDAHRADYDAFYVAPAREFVSAIGPELRKISKKVHFEPKVNGSIFRIQRDVRFARDKSPYKAHLDFWFWEGERRGWDTPGFFLRLAPSTMTAGAGMHAFPAPMLAAYRAAVLDARPGAALERIAAALDGLVLGGAARKTIPRGFAADHRRARFLLHDGLYAVRETALPKSVPTLAFIGECLGCFRKAWPVSKWLLDHVARVAPIPAK